MYQICQSRLNILPNKKKNCQKFAKDFNKLLPNVVKFRQIWSHWYETAWVKRERDRVWERRERDRVWERRERESGDRVRGGDTIRSCFDFAFEESFVRSTLRVWQHTFYLLILLPSFWPIPVSFALCIIFLSSLLRPSLCECGCMLIFFECGLMGNNVAYW